MSRVLAVFADVIFVDLLSKATSVSVLRYLDCNDNGGEDVMDAPSKQGCIVSNVHICTESFLGLFDNPLY
jgi:hypothetical protein